MGMTGAIDTVTVINKTENGYVSTVVNGVYWYMSESVSVQGRGFGISSERACIFPYEALQNYVDGNNLITDGKFSLQYNDYVIKGDVSNADIQSVKDVNEYKDVITIKSINKCLKGSTNIQHIKVW